MKLEPGNSYVSKFACLQYAYRELLDGWMIAVSMGIVAAMVVVFTVIGPLGIDDSLGPLQRLAFVGSCCILCWPLCHALTGAILYLMRSRPPVQIMLATTAGALFMAIPCASVTYTVYELFHSDDAAQVEPAEIYLTVSVLALACSCLIHYVACQRVALRLASTPGQSMDTRTPSERQRNAGEEAARRRVQDPGRDTDRPVDSFFERVPDSLGRDLVYLRVSGHYINVATAKGSCLVLMRFADAIAQLGDVGMQVHRSYWVAFGHIIGVLRRDDRMLLRVTGGHEVPVSRTHLAAVRAFVPSRNERGPRPRQEWGTTEGT